MGSACCNDKSKDDKVALDYVKRQNKPEKMDAQDLKYFKENEAKIIKIQAGIRGYNQRKHQNNEEGRDKLS